MPVMRVHKLLACGSIVALFGVLACGDDDSSPGHGTKHKDGGASLDASLDASMDAEVDEPPVVSKPIDAGKHDASNPTPHKPDSGTDAEVVTVPTCADLDCSSLSDECNVATCNPKTVTCVIKAVADDTPCGSQELDNCSAPDRCTAGVCEPRHAAAGTACGIHADCRVDSTCDGDGNCVDNGLAPEGTACGSQTPSDPDCDAADTCDADGVCQPNYASADTSCGDKDISCRYDDKCDGFGSCQDGGLWEAGACPMGEDGNSGKCICGRTDQTFCHPDKDLCNAGTCELGNDDGKGCGNLTPTDAECDDADSCVGGFCSPNAKLAGTACGNHVATHATCDRADTCDGGGHCDPNHAGTDVTCGAAPGACADPKMCDGNGGCAAAQLKDAGTVCAAAPDACHLEFKCTGGSATCPGSAAPTLPGTPCGNPNATDPTCDAPDSCDGAGVCDTHHAVVGTTCGDQDPTECSNPDTCDATGACNPRNLPAGTDCGDQGVACLLDDSCNASGVCVDGGYDSPCGLDGKVTANNVGVSGITVKITGPGAAVVMDTTDGSGNFMLDAPLGQEVQLSATDTTGYYGLVRARSFTAADVGQSLELSLSDDAGVEEVAAALSATQDVGKGVVIVFVSGADMSTVLSGAEGAMISAASDQPIAVNGGDPQRSSTIMTHSEGALFFYNVTPGTTMVTPINGTATTCQRVSSLSSFIVLPHATTFVDIVCH
jgi:hypothetical protein